MSFKKVFVRVNTARYFFTCDLCKGEWNSPWKGNSKCEICDKDICQKCTIEDSQIEDKAKDLLYEGIDGEKEDIDNIYLREELADFPTRFCKECWVVYKPYQKQILKIFEKFPIEIGNIVKNFKKRFAELNLSENKEIQNKT